MWGISYNYKTERLELEKGRRGLVTRDWKAVAIQGAPTSTKKQKQKKKKKTLSSSYFPSPIGGNPAGNQLARERATIPKAWSWRLVKITDIGDP